MSVRDKAPELKEREDVEDSCERDEAHEETQCQRAKQRRVHEVRKTQSR